MKKKIPTQNEVHQRMRGNNQKESNYIGLTIMLTMGTIITAFLIGYWLLNNAANKISSNHSQVDEVKIKKGRPFSVLIMGTDVGALGRGNSYAGNTDTMELLTINPTQRRATITAIPRDTLVKINNKGKTEYVKINAAYAIGGPNLAKKQVQELLGVPVNYYALVNMGTLEKIVNAVGGVEVDNPFSFKFDGHKYPKGEQILNGKQALGYSRMRYDDPDNDYGRQRRGQQVLLSAMAKFKKKGNLVAAEKMLVAVKDGVRTDIPLANFRILYKNYSSSLNSFENLQLRGKDAKIEGIDYQVATPKELNRVSKTIRKALGLRVVNVDNEETKLVKMQTTWNGYNNIDFKLPNN